MATLPTDKTNNPPGSTAPVDMNYNAALLDCLLSSEGTFSDRLGSPIRSWREALTNLGFVIAGDFGQTFVISDRNQLALDTSTGNAYQWTLGLPKSVTPTDQPTDNGWSIVSDAALRTQLASSEGQVLVDGPDNVADLSTITVPSGSVVATKGYTTPGDGGHAMYFSRGQGWPITADGYGNHSDAAGNYLEIMGKDALYSIQWGATGQIAQNFSPNAAAMVAFAFANGIGKFFLRSGYHRFTQSLMLGRSINIEGPNKGGNGYDSAIQDRAVILHDFEGDMIVADGSVDINAGIGGKLSQVDIVQYLGHPNSSDPSFVGSAGSAVRMDGSTVANRAGRWEFDGVSFERYKDSAGSANHWTWNILIDGQTVGGSDGVRNFYANNMRLLTGSGSQGAARINGGFNFYATNVQADDEDGSGRNIMEITGASAGNESTNINMTNCTGFNYSFDFCRNVNIAGGSCQTYSSTSNTSDVTFTGTRVTTLPATEQPGVRFLGTDGASLVTKVPETTSQKFGRDNGWNDSSNTTLITVGNLGSNQGDVDMLYINGTSQSGGTRAKFRNTADNGNFIASRNITSKEPGNDNCQNIQEVNGTIMLRQFDANTSSPKVEYKGRLRPVDDNFESVGDPTHRPTEYFGVNGSINTSDARLKTPVSEFSEPEINAAKQLANEIGLFQWLDRVETKGADGARLHTGMTVQRAIEIMKGNGLDPFRYSFICYDEWGDEPEVSYIEPAEFDESGKLVKEECRVVVQKAVKAGSRYSFRDNELERFMIVGVMQSIKDIDERLKKAGL